MVATLTSYLQKKKTPADLQSTISCAAENMMAYASQWSEKAKKKESMMAYAPLCMLFDAADANHCSNARLHQISNP